MSRPIKNQCQSVLFREVAFSGLLFFMMFLFMCQNNTIQNPDRITVDLGDGVTMNMLRIPAGRFMMGSESGREEDETPVHKVTFDYDFYMGETELTQAQWLAVMGTWPDPQSSPDEKYHSGLPGEYPAYFISWHDCHDLAEALNEYVQETGQGAFLFRLPTEAEWEYACRAGTTGEFPFDTTRADEYMWYEDEEDHVDGIKPVAKKLPNPWGLFDMNGNVWEWCEDWYHDSYEGAPSDGSAWIEPKGEFVILHGGDWDNRMNVCRCANRNDHRKPTDRSEDIGVRLVCTIKSAK